MTYNKTEDLSKIIKDAKKAIEEATKLSTKKRNKLRDETFAFPKQRKMPLNDASHVRSAAARFNQLTDVSEAEKRSAYQRILKAGKKFGVDLSGFKEKFGKKYG